MNKRKMKWLSGILFLFALLFSVQWLHTNRVEASEDSKLVCLSSAKVESGEISKKSIKPIEKVKEHKRSNTGYINLPRVNAGSIASYSGNYGYTTLSASGRKAYNALNRIATEFHNSGVNADKIVYSNGSVGYVTESTNISSYNVYIQDLPKIIFALEADHPIFYWYQGVSYSSDGNGKVTNIYITVNKAYYKASTRKTVQTKIDSGLAKYCSVVDVMKQNGASVFQIELAIHDLLIDKCNYALDSKGQAQTAAWAHNIYGIFGKDSAVCEGYAKAFQLLMNYAGIESIYAIGYGGTVGHAWNLVKLNGVWYGVDTTWDDTGDLASKLGTGVMYNYFNCSTKLFAVGHTYNKAVFKEMYNVPAVTSNDSYWYYSYYKLKLTSANLTSEQTFRSALGTAIGRIESVSQYRLRLALNTNDLATFKRMYNTYGSTMASKLSTNGIRYSFGSPIYWSPHYDLAPWVFVDIPVSVLIASNIHNNASYFDTYQYDISYTDAYGVIDITSKVSATSEGNTLIFSYNGDTIGKYIVDKVNVNAEPIAAVNYSGSPQTPKPVLTVGKTVLIEGVDYTLSYDNNCNAGTAKVIATGIGRYQGQKIVEFSITPIPLEGAVVAPIKDKAYTAAAIKPALTITSANGLPIAASDYTVSYQKNKNIGIATVTVTGKENYKGTLTTTFNIVKRKLSTCTFETISNQAYTGKMISPRFKVKIGSKTLTLNRDYRVSYSNNKKIGRAKIKVTAIGNSLSGSKTLYFNIVPKRVSNVILSTGNNKMIAKWSKVSYANGYRIVYATALNGTYRTWGYTSKTYYTKTGLVKGRTYYIGIMPYKIINGKKQYGEVSRIVRIIIK